MLTASEQKISYAKEKSQTLAKMTGQYDPPLQPGAPKEQAQPANTLPAPPGLAPPGVSAGVPPPGIPPPGLAPPPGAQNAPSPQGVKRSREESDNEEDGSEMEMSDDE